VNFAYKLREGLRVDLFSQNDLKALLYPMTNASIHNGVSRALRSKDLLQLKRGLYLFSKNLRRSSLSKFLIANKMYGPSYVSFESALSHYGLIPEGVYTTTSACHQRKTKNFKTELGDFSYEYVPCSDFFQGVIHDKEKGGILIATPLKAFFDLVCLRKKHYQTADEIERDLRIEMSELRAEVSKYSVSEIEELAKQYKKKNVMNIYNLLIRAYK
jgi:predicted transcriptional regulator of viral defense system